MGCPDRRIDRLCITCCSPSQPSHHAGGPARSRLRRKRDGVLVAFAPGHHGPDHPRHLVGECDGGDLGRPPRQQCRKPGPMRGAVDLRIANDGERAGHEQAAQIAIALFADIAEPVLAPARVLLRHQSNPGREVAARAKGLWVSDAGDQGRSQHWADAGDRIEPLARLIRSVPSHDHPIELQNLFLEPAQLTPSAARHIRATTGTRLSLASVTTLSNVSIPLRPTGATIPNSARWARITLITAVCWRMNRWRVRWSVKQLCCSGVLVSTNRMFALVTASQMASASAASFFWRLT